MGNLIEWGANSVDHFGDPLHEFEAARTAVAISPANRFTLLLFRGADAKAFLQGQVTCDLEQLGADQATFGGYCTPKGRLLASFLLLSTAKGYLMYLPADIASGVAARLRKFILRAKVTIEEESGSRAFGLTGPLAPALIEEWLHMAAPGKMRVATGDDVAVVRMAGDTFIVISPVATVGMSWATLARKAVPAGENCWSWTQIDAGIPWVTAATQDRFLPQMLGLDAIGGVSFEKGCYAGQEIVARARYLGEVKRALRFGRTPARATSGDALTRDGQPAGTVLNAAGVPDAGSELLAVVNEQSDSNTALTLATGEIVALSPARAV